MSNIPYLPSGWGGSLVFLIGVPLWAASSIQTTLTFLTKLRYYYSLLAQYENIQIDVPNSSNGWFNYDHPDQWNRKWNQRSMLQRVSPIPQIEKVRKECLRARIHFIVIIFAGGLLTFISLIEATLMTQ